MSEAAVRVISLLPAATDVASLGMLDALLGVSHDCDYPEEVNRKPPAPRTVRSTTSPSGAGRIPWLYRGPPVVEAAPEVLVLACCGYSVERTVADLPILRSYPGFEALPTAQCGEVYVVDGSAYFSRPGPRIADSLEIVAEILHPESFRGQFPDRGVARVG